MLLTIVYCPYNWTVQRYKSGWSCTKLNGPKGLQVDGLRKWAVQRVLNGPSTFAGPSTLYLTFLQFSMTFLKCWKWTNLEFEIHLTLNLAYEWFKFGNPDWIMIILIDLSSLPAKHSLKLIDSNEKIIFRRLYHQNILISDSFRETKNLVSQ